MDDGALIHLLWNGRPTGKGSDVAELTEQDSTEVRLASSIGLKGDGR